MCSYLFIYFLYIVFTSKPKLVYLCNIHCVFYLLVSMLFTGIHSIYFVNLFIWSVIILIFFNILLIFVLLNDRNT